MASKKKQNNQEPITTTAIATTTLTTAATTTTTNTPSVSACDQTTPVPTVAVGTVSGTVPASAISAANVSALTESQVREAEIRAIREALLEPFEPEEIKWKPQLVKGTRAMAIAYVDARVVQDRLDEVLGVDGWQDECTPLDDGSVVCKLQLRIGGQWITKMDVGSPSEQPDGGDRLKAAFSDALKRAAVKFGVGRYLYRLDRVWVEYDPQRKQIVRPPQLPDDALPRHLRRNKPAAAGQQPTANNRPVNQSVKSAALADADVDEPTAEPTITQAPAKPATTAKPAPAGKPTSHALPKDSKELLERLNRYEAKLVEDHVCRPGELLAHIIQAGQRAGLGDNIAGWPTSQFELASREAKTFVQQRRTQSQSHLPTQPAQPIQPSKPHTAVA